MHEAKRHSSALEPVNYYFGPYSVCISACVSAVCLRRREEHAWAFSDVLTGGTTEGAASYDAQQERGHIPVRQAAACSRLLPGSLALGPEEGVQKVWNRTLDNLQQGQEQQARGGWEEDEENENVEVAVPTPVGYRSYCAECCTKPGQTGAASN
jgi:hypothetical protein